MTPPTPATLGDVADALGDRLLESMPAGGAYGREALARMPEPVEHLLVAALERRVAREAALPESEWIDVDDPAVRTAARAWREAARGAGRFPPGAWPAALRDAARQALNHLVDPAAAAGAHCFAGESGALPTATVRARLDEFGPYPYLGEIAARYADRKELETFDRASLESLLRRIDRRMAASYGAGEWAALAAPLFGLVGALPGLDGRLPADVLRRFFAARGAESLAGAMATRPAWSPAEMHDALVVELAGVRPEAAGETVDLSAAAFDVSTGVPPARSRSEAGVAGRPLWESLAPGGHPPERRVEEPGASEPLWQTLARGKDAGEPASRPETLAGLEARVLGGGAIAQRDVFIAEVAGGSEAAYRALLEELDAAGTWEEAWPALARAFQANEVDIYGEAAVAFTDAVERRFSG